MGGSCGGGIRQVGNFSWRWPPWYLLRERGALVHRLLPSSLVVAFFASLAAAWRVGAKTVSCVFPAKQLFLRGTTMHRIIIHKPSKILEARGAARAREFIRML